MILEREIEFPENILVTITNVITSHDMYYAEVLISILGKEIKEALEILSKNIYHIQQKLNKKLRIRPVPKIHFEIDTGEAKREEVESSLAELKKKKEI